MQRAGVYEAMVGESCGSMRSFSFFFFSSRRRHTRCSRDWSSDVCSSDLAGGAKGGFGFSGGGGDFGSRYGWYVQVVQQKVRQNWLAYEVDPRIKEANRFYLVFDITRDGRPTNVRVEQSSGIPSLDISAIRAVQRIDTFGPLPSEYSGSKVSVEFWFDYKK